MLALPASVRVFVASKPINMHFSFDKLAGIVPDHLGQEPMNGHLYVFFNKRADKVKILVWDRHGWSLLCKRLEAGTFKPPNRVEVAQQQVEIENVQLALILESIDLTEVVKKDNAKPEKEKTRKRPKCSGRNGSIPPDFSRQEQIIDVSAAEKQCCGCGRLKVVIGCDITEQLNYIPSQLNILRTVYPKYACGRCSIIKYLRRHDRPVRPWARASQHLPCLHTLS